MDQIIFMAAMEVINAVSKDNALVENIEPDTMSLIYSRCGRTDEQIEETARRFKTAFFIKYQTVIKIKYRIMEDTEYNKYLNELIKKHI